MGRTVTSAEWIRITDPDQLREWHVEPVRGVSVSIQISPYDLPEACRGYYLPERGHGSRPGKDGVFRIEFKYVDDEPRERKQQDSVVTVETGRHSKKLLAIEVAVGQQGINLVRLTVQQAIDRADRMVRELKSKASRPNARLNYDVVNKVLASNRDQLVSSVS